MAHFTALLALLAGLLLPAAAAGQSAPGAGAASGPDALFHAAAQHYIGEDAAAARRLVERGLRLAPDHPRLRALKKKLDEQQKQQNGSGQKGQQQKQQQDGQQGRQQDKNQQSNDQPKKGQQQDGDPKNQNGKQQSGGQQQSAQQQSGGQQQRSPQPGGQAQGRLNKQQAERILQAMRSQEKQLLRQTQRRKRSREPVEKDW